MPPYNLPDAQESIRWDELEKLSQYRKNFGKTDNLARSFRIAFGALVIQTKLKLSDEEAVEQVRKNLYLQYFLGLEKHEGKAPFRPSLRVYFRKRLVRKDPERLQRQKQRVDDPIASVTEPHICPIINRCWRSWRTAQRVGRFLNSSFLQRTNF